MNPNETSENGTRPIFYNGEQVEQPWASSFDSMESSDFSSIPDEVGELVNSLFRDVLDSCPMDTLCHGACLCGMCPKVQSLPSIPDDDWIHWNVICPSSVGTERDHGSSPPMMSPVSQYSCPTMPSTPEDAEAQNSMEGSKSAIDNDSVNCISVSKPGCSRTCTGCQDAHRLTASEVAIKKKFFKGVSKKKKNSDKWTCEIRISKKLLQDSKLKANSKLWIGTFDTRCQAARALHVGRFLLSEKKNSATNAPYIEQSSKTILSKYKDLMRAQSLDAEFLGTVRGLAVDYGKKGLL